MEKFRFIPPHGIVPRSKFLGYFFTEHSQRSRALNLSVQAITKPSQVMANASKNNTNQLPQLAPKNMIPPVSNGLVNAKLIIVVLATAPPLVPRRRPHHPLPAICTTPVQRSCQRQADCPDYDSECPICMEKFETVCLPCSHTFCRVLGGSGAKPARPAARIYPSN